MLQHMQNLLNSSLEYIESQGALFAVQDYLTRLEKFADLIEHNCTLSHTPIQKGVVRRILTSHTDFYHRLLDMELEPNTVHQINLEELSKMIQSGVYVWNNEFRTTRQRGST